MNNLIIIFKFGFILNYLGLFFLLEGKYFEVIVTKDRIKYDTLIKEIKMKSNYSTPIFFDGFDDMH